MYWRRSCMPAFYMIPSGCSRSLRVLIQAIVYSGLSSFYVNARFLKDESVNFWKTSEHELEIESHTSSPSVDWLIAGQHKTSPSTAEKLWTIQTYHKDFNHCKNKTLKWYSKDWHPIGRIILNPASFIHLLCIAYSIRYLILVQQYLNMKTWMSGC